MTTTTRARWIAVAVVLAGLIIVGTLTGGDDSTDHTSPSTSTVTTRMVAEDDPGPSSTSLGPAPGSSSTIPDAPPPPTTTPTPPGPSSGPVANTARVLDGIPVKGRAPKTGYDRAHFGPAWTDNVDVAGGHNGCDTRNDILRRDLTDVTTRPGTDGCIILTGVLDDPYTGKRIAFRRGQTTSSAVQIDHVVALNDAWQKGAQQLGADQRRAFANDPLNLLAVDGPANQQKGASDAATWLPKNKSFRCRYVAIQIHVKARYELWMTAAEHRAIGLVLSECTDTQVGALG